MEAQTAHTTDTEEYEEELRSALVCEDNVAFKTAIKDALERLQCTVEFSEGAEDALEKLKFNQYAVVVLNERFGGPTPENNDRGPQKDEDFSGGNSVYTFLKAMPMSTRRRILLVLSGKEFKTGDDMTAFSKSVNVVVNEKDTPNLKTVLKKAIADNDTFYKVFHESLGKMGKL